VLDYERASEVVRSASHRSVGICYCRHKMMHMGRACDAPMDICMTFNNTSAALARHGYARAVDVAEGLDLLQEARDCGLVQFGENVQHGVNFICNCCGCCCEAMIAARRVGFTNAVQTTNYLPVVDEGHCNGCGKCVTACPVEAMALVSTNDPHHPKLRKARVDTSLCLGCGVCVRACTRAGLCLEERPQRVITPVDSAHKTVLMAVERGMLPNLIFDNQALASHRVMAAILGGVLRLPPVQQAMASEQVRSRYLVKLLEWGQTHFTAQ
jgi:ferredoxin